jgi:quercetin dioxygenase-like cupin family protein
MTARPAPAVAHLGEVAGAGNGVQWTLPAPSQLNVNLVHLDPGASIADHVAHDVDVVVLVLAGTGVLEGIDLHVELAEHMLIHLPAGTSRALRAGPAGLGYVTVHRRRGPMQIGEREP